jgi:hypothetical protein
MDADRRLLTALAGVRRASPGNVVREPNIIRFSVHQRGAQTHSASTKTGRAAAGAVAWMLNAVLLTIMASGFALSVVAYSVAAWNLFNS